MASQGLGIDALANGKGAVAGGRQTTYAMPEGRGWSACEAYVRHLKATSLNEAAPTCDLKLDGVPGGSEPQWEVLSIQENLFLIHQIERTLGVGRIEPEPDRDLDRWKTQFEARIAAQGETPRLRRARLPIASGGAVETVLAYDLDLGFCEKEVKKAKRGSAYDPWLDRPTFFVFDEATQRVLGGGRWNTHAQGTLWVYRGKPYYVTKYFGGVQGKHVAEIYVKRLEATTPGFSTGVNAPSYVDRELCRIQFANPLGSNLQRK